MTGKKLVFFSMFGFTALLLSAYFIVTKNKTPEITGNPLKDEPVEMPFPMPEIPVLSFPNNTCNISDYGAIGDGKFLNTKIFATAISDCAKKGGGKVVVPPGRWLTGPIRMQSNIDLDLQEGSVIVFSSNFSDYLPVVFSRFEGIEFYNYSPFIYARNCENIAITGKGSLDGQGQSWWAWEDMQKIGTRKLYELAEQGTPVEQRIFGTERDGLRPSFVQFVGCRNILFEDFTVENGPMWTIHPLYSENILIKNIKISSSGPNSDGIVIDSSKNVLVDGAVISSGDDAIAIKSGKDKDGLFVNRPSENIVIKNCEMKKGHGGVSIGSETSGSIRNILIANLNIGKVEFGIHIKSMRGRGGIVENIWAENIYIDRALQTALRVDLTYGTPNDPKSAILPVFQNIHFRDIVCRRANDAIFFSGLSKSLLENITLENIKISSSDAIVLENVGSKSFTNVDITKRK